MGWAIVPLIGNLTLIKRIKKINSSGELWIEGDNPDPTSSDDSHNFGYISKENIVAYCNNRRA